jgi:hypothetical protein
MSNDGDSFPDGDGSDEDHSDLSEDTESNGDSDIDDGMGSKRGGQVGGRRARWSLFEEQRLKTYVKEDKDWPWIAGKLGRTEVAVAQHWRMMSQGPGRHVGHKK